MKVAILFRGSSGGIPHIVAIANFLVQAGIDTHLIGLATEEKPPPGLTSEVTFIPLTCKATLPFGRSVEAVRLRRLIHREGFEILHIAGHGPLATCLLAGVLTMSLKIAFQAFDPLEPRRFPVRAWIWGWFLRRCHLVVDVELNRAHFLKSIYRLKVLPTVVPNRIGREWPIPTRSPDLRRKLQQGLAHGNAVVVIYQGYLARDRHTQIVTEAMAYLPAHFLLHTFGPVESVKFKGELDAVVLKHHLETRVFFHPNISHESLLFYTVCADIGVLFYGDEDLGNYYCSPNKVSEYAACGLPMVGPHYPGIAELFRKHGLGETVDPRDPHAIAGAIRRVAESVPGLKARSSKVRRAFVDQLAFEHHGPRLVDEYRKLCP